VTLARLLAAALLLCSLSAFAEDRQVQDSQSSTPLCSKGWPGCVVEGPVLRDKLIFFAWSHYNVATPAEPWRIIPIRPADLSFGQIPPYKPGLPQVEYVRYFGWKVYGLVTGPIYSYSSSQLPEAAARWQPVFYFTVDPPCIGRCPRPARPVCYAILGYVAARDSRNSDPMQPAGYTTCQEALRYQSKTTETRSNTPSIDSGEFGYRVKDAEMRVGPESR
jgi:hypothetical protein